MMEFPKKYTVWHGTDALKLVLYPPGKFTWKVRIFLHRALWRMIWRFFDVHYINHLGLKKALVDFGIAKNKICVRPVGYSKVSYPKKEHVKFTVLFYVLFSESNSKYNDWIYGKEVLEYLMQNLTGVKWIILDGTNDMAEVYPIVDLYIKVNRTIYNNLNRIAKECLFNKISVLVVEANDNYKEVLAWINTRKDTWYTKKKRAVS